MGSHLCIVPTRAIAQLHRLRLIANLDHHRMNDMDVNNTVCTMYHEQHLCCTLDDYKVESNDKLKHRR